MKKYLLILVVFAMASALGLGAQNLLENPDYQKSLELKDQAAAAFDAGDYDSAAKLAAESKDYAARSDEYVAKMVAKVKAERAIAAAKQGLAAAKAKGWNIFYAAPYGEAAATIGEADAALAAQDYTGADDKAALASEQVDGIAKVDAEAAIADAKAAMSDAEGLGAPKSYPTEYETAKAALGDALSAFDSGDYPSSAARARACVAALAEVKGSLIQWPAVYVVRLIPARRDCLWRIAEYPFIYDDPLKWPVIYDANKKTFRDPGNPNLIFPGQKLTIPSISGETRSGTYDPKVQYPTFPKK